MAREDQRQRSEAVRRAIVDTALEIGMEEGFEALSVRKIINRMRYSTGVVYHHFRDKQEIIDAIEAAETERMREKIAGLLDDSKGIVENMTAVFHEIMLLALNEPEKYNLIVLHKYSRGARGRPRWIGYIGEGLQKGMQAGIIRRMDAEKAAFAIWSSFLGFNLMISRHTDLAPAEAEALFQTQLQMILRGILHHG
ncbi:MAG: TetR/AcrR family transcriptional regulator [Clostridiales bacterium]|nr:TetR/AcrR family transcriptional regulator [Clostridiales bacterium]